MTETISILADRFGLTTDTLRYYERLGLLRPTRRSPAGYRLYDEDVAERLRFIRGAQHMGLRLGDIKELLEVQDRGQCPCGHTASLVERRLAQVESEIKELLELKRSLLALKERNDQCMDGSAGEWPCCI